MDAANIVISLSTDEGRITITTSLPRLEAITAWATAVASVRLATVESRKKKTGQGL